MISKTLSAATVDTVTFADGVGEETVIYNRGPATIFAVSGRTLPADPTVGGDNCLPILPNTKESLGGGRFVKIIGNGDAYTLRRM
jgi:hypothetical protein